MNFRSLYTLQAISILLGMTCLTSVASAVDIEISPHTPKAVLSLPETVGGGDTKLIVIGKFPNSCYSLGHINQVVDVKKFQIHLGFTMASPKGMGCLQAESPYTQEISLGLLPAGTYLITVNGKPSSPLIVAEGWDINPTRHSITEVAVTYNLADARADGRSGTFVVQGIASCRTKVTGIKLTPVSKGATYFELVTENDTKPETCTVARQAFQHETRLAQIPEGMSILFTKGSKGKQHVVVDRSPNE